MNASNGLYDDAFYQHQVSGSYQSAKVYARLLAAIYTPKGIVDFGCGRGTWLKAFKEVGASKLVGFDGKWNTQENMIDQSIVFIACDLNEGIPASYSDKFDLAISLEVAEHLEPSSADTAVRSLVRLSDAVLFSAAFTGQGGTNHINEQPHTYWARKFASHSYVPFDIFRPIVWGDTRVKIWYRKNAFLYVRKHSPTYESVRSRNIAPMNKIEFMDCVESIPFLMKLPLRQSVRLIPRVLTKLRRRLISLGRSSRTHLETP